MTGIGGCCARRKRPCCGSAAEKRDALAAFHIASILAAWPAKCLNTRRLVLGRAKCPFRNLARGGLDRWQIGDLTTRSRRRYRWVRPSPATALVSDVAIDDEYTETILRIAGTAPSANE